MTSEAAVQAATASDPLSAAPQQALLAVAAAAALLAVTGFLVSIAANVRQRRTENALLAALGVAQRSAAAQLFLEKVLLSVPAAALGLVLGTLVARLLVPAVTLTTTAQTPCRRPSRSLTSLRRCRSRSPSPCFRPSRPPLSSSAAPTRRPSCARRRRHETATRHLYRARAADPVRGVRRHRRGPRGARDDDPGAAGDHRRRPAGQRASHFLGLG